jgi:hypothetical protein
MADRRAHTRPTPRPHAADLAASRNAARAARPAVLAVVVLMVASGCGSGGGTSAARPDTDATSQTPTQVPTPEPSSSPVDLGAFAAIDRAGWDAIAADPEAAAGQQVVVYGVVEWFFSATGPGVLQASVTTSQPADPAEGTGAVVRADPALLQDVQVGDVVQLHAQVTGTFGGDSGATDGVPELQGLAVEEVGLRDLTADVVLGAPAVAGGGVNLPVTITNSGDVVMDYRVDVMATSADGTQNFGTITARGSMLAPGQVAQASVRFPGALPAGVVYTVASVTRVPTSVVAPTT